MSKNELYKELMWAIENKDLQQVKKLIQQGVNINKQDEMFKTPLMKSIESGSNEIAELLLENGAQVNLVGQHKTTALLNAVYYGNYDIAKKLIDKGAKLNIKNSIRKTPLHYAMEKGYKELAMLLIEKGADYNVYDIGGTRVLDLALEEENKDIYELIIQKEKEQKIKMQTKRDIYIDKLRERLNNDLNSKDKFLETSIQTYTDLKMRNDVELEKLSYEELNNLLQLYNYNNREETPNTKEETPITDKELIELAKDMPIYIRGVDRLTGVQKYRKREIRQHNETGGKTEIRKLARKEGEETLTNIQGVKTGNYNRCVSMANFGKIVPFLSVGYGIIKKDEKDVHMASKDDLFSEVVKEDDMIYRDDDDTNDRENIPIDQRLRSIFEYLRDKKVADKFNEVIMDVADKDVKFVYWCKKDHLNQFGKKAQNITYDKLQSIYFQRKYYEKTGRVLPIIEYKPNESRYLKGTTFSDKEIVDMLKKEILDASQKSLMPEYDRGSAVDFLITFNNEIMKIPNAKELMEKFIQDRVYEYLDKNNIESVYDVINVAKYAKILKGEEYQQECIKKMFNNILDLDTIMDFLDKKSKGALYTSGKQDDVNKNIGLVVEILSQVRDVATDETMEFLKPKLDEVVKGIRGKLSLIEIKRAIRNNDIVAIDKIIERGIDLNAEDIHGKTPLMYFAETRKRYDCEPDKNLLILKKLQNARADINYVTKDGQTALGSAIERGSIEIMDILLKEGADITIKNNNGETPLLFALNKGGEEKVKMLLKICNNVNVGSNDGFTPLTLAVRKGYIEITNMLIDKGAYVDMKDKRGRFPIMEAIQNNDVKLVKLLIERGADVRDIDKFNRDIRKDINSPERKEILKILQEAKKNQNKKLPKLKKLTKEQIVNLRETKGKIQVKTEPLINVKENAQKLEKAVNNSLDKKKDKPKLHKLTSKKIEDLKQHKEQIHVNTEVITEFNVKHNKSLNNKLFNKDKNNNGVKKTVKYEIE